MSSDISNAEFLNNAEARTGAVSYTHLDVYKRQIYVSYTIPVILMLSFCILAHLSFPSILLTSPVFVTQSLASDFLFLI